MYFIRLRFITHLDCLPLRRCSATPLYRVLCSLVLFAAVYRLVLRQQKRSRSCCHSRTATDRFRCDGS